MLRTATLLILASFVLIAYGTTGAQAISPSQQECENGGGTFTNFAGTKVCVFPEENVGNAPSHSNSQTTQETVSGQGNLHNKREEECLGPPGQCNK